ncbi:APC family permease [Arthrobacter sp. FX8]|uniref:APC family permease n=1 Tax=Arthrobacter sp. FX8 TaxID=2997335 RepID=UPI00227D6C4E|nr:APC family permease [Arthrobacter sp. FX8]WAJ32939.1 APC family permease [Arthrobacter sp. FX8]
MSNVIPDNAVQGIDQSKLRSSAMGTGGLVFTVVAMIGPMAAFLGATPLVFMLSGAGTAGVYLLATALFLIFAVGYVALARRSKTASGLIAFIVKGLGIRAGVAAAYVTLLTYVAVLSSLYGIHAVFLQQAAMELFGIDLPWGFWAIITLAILTPLSYNRVEFSARIMGVLLVLAVAAILVLDVAILVQGGAGGGFTFEGFSPQLVFGPGIGLAALFALGSFVGVEATPVFSEEVRTPQKTVPRATYITIIVLGVFYVLSTFMVSNAVGSDKIVDVATENPTGFILDVAGAYVGPIWVKILNVLVVTSFFAILLGFANVMSRYVFALGRAGILPAAVGRSHKKHQSPHIGSIVTAITVLVVVGAFILASADPFHQLYAWLIAVGSLGVLLLMCASSIAVVMYFKKSPDGENVWTATIAPVIAAIAFVVAIVLTILNFSFLSGGEGFAEWLWVLVPLSAVIGLIVRSRQRNRELSFDDIS